VNVQAFIKAKLQQNSRKSEQCEYFGAPGRKAWNNVQIKMKKIKGKYGEK
jgi:hypothetical protein